MNSLKNRIQLKIKIPKQNNKEEEHNNKIVKIVDNNRNTISQITDSIYISGYLIGKNLQYLKSNNFTHVINCSLGSSMECPIDEFSTSQEFKKAQIKYLSVCVRDAPEVDIIDRIFKIIDFIESDKITQNKKILFHCIEGVSRAPAMVAGYLMWKQNLTCLSAIELIKSKRKCADINLGFNIQLNKWENFLFSSPKQIQIFKLTPYIRLLEENEIEIDKHFDEDYLIKIKNQLFYVNNIHKTCIENNENLLMNKINRKDMIFNVYKDKIKEFVKNVVKYDKNLLKNDFSSLLELRYS